MRKLLSFLPYRILLFYVYTLFFSTKINRCLSSINEWYESCGKEFNCGDIKGISYPFWGDDRPIFCGYAGLELKCRDNITTMEIKKVKYRVLGITPNTQSIKIARNDFLGGVCKAEFVNTTLDDTLFDYSPGYGLITIFYGCLPLPEKKFSCTIDGIPYNGNFYALGSPGPGLLCKVSVVVPISKEYLGVNLTEGSDRYPSNLYKPLTEGFEVNLKVDYPLCLKCRKSSGRCAYNHSSNQPTCLCPNGSQVPDACDESIAGDFKPASSTAPEWSGSNDQCNTCFGSGGKCGYNSSEGGFACFCKDGPNASKCTGKKSNITTIAAGIFSACLAGLILVFIAVICWLRKKPSSLKAFIYRGKDKKNCQKLEEFVKTFGSTLPRRYNYSDIKKMTKSLMEKLGEGGYGSVYKGKLSDGRFVAVKVLSESKSDGEDFINEVASISRTSHINVVSLIGFCLEDTRKALIYEFMPNGSLDKLIYNERLLEWEKMFQIAVGIARGLEYLHRGCNTKILHFDIKPQNILLDGDWCPKISDFGLAKLCKRKESIVSMKGARGTAGYMAPEMFSRYFGGVSHKSDVYSYGMMVFEMVGGRKNLKLDVSKTSEIYFPFWVYKHLEVGEDFNIDDILNEEQEEITKKMILVSFWCIQTNPMDRPSMSKVVDMLQGSLQSIKTPPKPVLYSPTRSPLDSLTISSP